MNINEMCKKCHQAAIDSEFWEDQPCVCLEIAGMLNFTQKSKPIADCGVCNGTGLMKADRNDGELIALIHSELSEALEALREDRRQLQPKKADIHSIQCNCGSGLVPSSIGMTGTKCPKCCPNDSYKWEKDTFEDELADVAIRLFDLCGARDIDLEWQISQKLAYNKNRPKKHGKKF